MSDSDKLDRTGLESYIDKYLDAMQKHEASPDLFSTDCIFTENGVRLPLGGEGLFHSMSGNGTYKFYVPDIETQQVAYIGTAREKGQPNDSVVAVDIRLKIRNNLITEAEQLVIRPDTNQPAADSNTPVFPPTGESIEKLGSPHEIFMKEIPENERASRKELIETANYYFTGMQMNDGKGYYPFADECVRIENGMQTTLVPLKEGEEMPDPKTSKMYSANWTCKQQFESGLLNFVTRIRDRRFAAVDRERGIVYAFGFFDHLDINWTWQIAELFKVEKGLITRIEAAFHRCPYGMNSGWSSYEDGISDKIQMLDEE